MRVVSEVEFATKIRELLDRNFAYDDNLGCVTGPGRSGAIAAVYTSHILHIPFIPYGQRPPIHLGRLLIIDTASESGATMRKAERKYLNYTPITLWVYQEPPRVAFWYEAPKPQRYRHEK